jgi:hypothetical protein
MAYNNCSGDSVEIWKKEAKACLSTFWRLTNDMDELKFTIMEGNCYDHLEELIDAAGRMKSLILTAEVTFSTEPVDEPEEIKKKEDERFDNMHEIILDVKSSVEKCLVSTMETVKSEIEEIRESTNTIAEYMDQEKSQSQTVQIDSQPTQRWTQARRRQCNLMIFGSFENGSNYSMEVNEVLRHLGVNLRADEFFITEIKKSSSYEKSILRVEFNSPDPVQVAMMNARRLKSFAKQVYIANDLSYQERARLRVKVQELKVKIEQQPEIYWTIKGYRIVSLGPRRISDLDDDKTGNVRKEPYLKRLYETDSDEEEG